MFPTILNGQKISVVIKGIFIFFLAFIILGIILFKNIHLKSYKFSDRQFFGLNFFHHFLLFDGIKIVFQTPPVWQVKHVLTTDFDSDKREELALVVWKKGSFGSDKPFWISESDKLYSDHLFLYQYKDTKLVPLWHSSRLEKPICQISIDDIDNNSETDLVVWEGEYKENSFSCKDTKKTFWRWNNWGFTKIE